ncbi:MAG: T9SS type A sorting domain-containing protein [Chitinivibrionia bacterium]|nr:T9SS type A sorting domain-containing protein [Chitinivibrionia bacterium]
MIKNITILLFCAVLSFASNVPLNILNFARTNGAFDVVKQNDTLWVATSGGLAQFQNSSTNFIALHHSHEHFPDISLTALAFDGSSLWIGSQSGFLYRRQRRGQRVFDDLAGGASGINTIKSHGNYLLIGHEGGVSVFNKRREHIISTKRNFPDFGIGAAVDLIEIKDDTLWVAARRGSDGGVFRLNGFSRIISDARFGDDSPLSAGDDFEWIQELYPLLSSPARVLFYDIYNNRIRYSDNFENMGIDKDRARFGDENITFVKRIDNRAFVGTEADYLWRSDDDRQFVVPGLVNNNRIRKLFVDSEQSLWILPLFDSEGPRHWSNALSRISRRGDVAYFNENTRGYGSLAGVSDEGFSGVAQVGDRIFFGYSGSPMREYNIRTNSWRIMLLDAINFTGSPDFPIFYETMPENFTSWAAIAGWNHVDVLLTDKNGIVWGTSWNHDPVEAPTVFAYDPNNNRFRFLLNFNRNGWRAPLSLAFTGRGDLLLGFGGIMGETDHSDSLWVIDANKNPFDENIPSADYRKSVIRVGSRATGLHTTGAGNVLIATTGEPRVFGYSRTLGARVFPIGNLPPSLSLNINDIAFEYSHELWSPGGTRIRNVFWVSSRDLGAKRIEIDEIITSDGFLDTVIYNVPQTALQTEFVLNAASGGINSATFAVAVDTVQNFLWVGGDRGITRMRLPERTVGASQQRNDFIFPNPFSLSRHEFITIPRVSQSSFVDVYTVSGKLVQSFNQNSPEWTQTVDGTFFYRWRIPSNLAPGTYIIAVKELESDRVARRNTKTYKLVIIP